MLALIFSAHGSYRSPQAFSDGVVAALPVGAAVLGAGALIALLVPGLRARRAAAAVLTLDSDAALRRPGVSVGVG